MRVNHFAPFYFYIKKNTKSLNIKVNYPIDEIC